MKMITTIKKALVFSLCLAVSPFSVSYSQPLQSVPWATTKISLHAQDREITDLLREFASIQKLPIAISEQVIGNVSGQFTDVDTRRFLDVICESNGLVWFYDGTKLYIETADAVVSRVMGFTHLSQQKLEDALYSIGYASGPKGREAAVKTGHRPGLLLFVGGPQFIRATETLANDLEAQEAASFEERMEVKTFRLKYATAADVTVQSGDQTTTLPGVARSLQNLMLEQQNDSSGMMMATGPMESRRPNARPTLKGSGLAAAGENPLMAAAAAASQESQGPVIQSRQPSASNGMPNSPMIVVDARLNAILVRDFAARMPLYEELIQMLDVPTQAVEITAAIVDLDASVGRDFGMEVLGIKNKESNIYRGGFDADRGLFDGVDVQGRIPSFVEGANLARGIGFNASALLTGFGYEALTRLRALEQEGKAQVVTSPSVLTMENVQAVIRTEEKVYVRVAGNMETDLYDVSTGVQFRVTPSVVTEGDAKIFRLTIEITDGSFVTTQTVDAIPGTRESSITTQAMVPESKTLLLGGYFVERKSKNFNGVPILSKIPILKHALSRQERGHARTQRYFFITPRLVNVHGEATPVPLDAPRNGAEMDDALPSKLSDDPDTDALTRKLATDSIRLRMPAQNSQPPGSPLVPALNDNKGSEDIEPKRQKKRPTVRTIAAPK